MLLEDAFENTLQALTLRFGFGESDDVFFEDVLPCLVEAAIGVELPLLVANKALKPFESSAGTAVTVIFNIRFAPLGNGQSRIFLCN